MNDQLVLDDDALASAASGLTSASQQMEQNGMRPPVGEVRGLTSIESVFSGFLGGIAAARRALGEGAHSAGLAVVDLMVESGDIDARIGGAVDRAVRHVGSG